MIESVFTPFGETAPAMTGSRRPRKGIVIGAGQVGTSCAYSMLIQNTVDEMVLIDINRERLEGEVMDLTHGLPFIEPTAVRAGTLETDGADADIVVMTAGAKQKPGESRLDLVSRNVDIFKDIVSNLVEYCPRAIVLVVTNPVDIMTYVTLKLSGLPKAQVFGSGTILDTARFRALLAERFEIDPRSLHAYIIGEHGDSEVPVWSKVNISGMHLFEANGADGMAVNIEDFTPVFEQVKNAAYEIIQRKGATNFAIGLGVTQIVQAVLRNQNRVLTVSSLIEEFDGIQDVCLSLPTVVNCQGISRVLKLSLSPTEKEQLQRSARVLRGIIDKLDL